jgi:hypothetical protein
MSQGGDVGVALPLLILAVWHIVCYPSEKNKIITQYWKIIKLSDFI